MVLQQISVFSRFTCLRPICYSGLDSDRSRHATRNSSFAISRHVWLFIGFVKNRCWVLTSTFLYIYIYINKCTLLLLGRSVILMAYPLSIDCHRPGSGPCPSPWHMMCWALRAPPQGPSVIPRGPRHLCGPPRPDGPRKWGGARA